MTDSAASVGRNPTSAATPQAVEWMECGKCRRSYPIAEFFDHECPPTPAASSAGE